MKKLLILRLLLLASLLPAYNAGVADDLHSIEVPDIIIAESFAEEDNVSTTLISDAARADTLAIAAPYIISGMKNIADTILSKSLLSLDFEAINSLCEDAIVLSDIDSAIAAIPSHADQVFRARQLIDDAKIYTSTQLFNYTEWRALKEKLNKATSSSTLTKNQISEITNSLEMVSRYEEAAFSLFFIIEDILKNDEIKGFLSTPDSKGMILETINNFKTDPSQKPRFHNLAAYPPLLSLYHSFEEAVTDQNHDKYNSIYREIENMIAQ